MRMKAGGSLSMNQERERFLSFLLKHPSTVAGARDRLRRKGLDEDTAEALVKEALDAALLDDALYARLFAEGHDSWGKNRIALELRRRGVSAEDVEATLADIDELARAKALLDSWTRGGLEQRKVLARLYRRGFSSATVSALSRGEKDIPW